MTEKCCCWKSNEGSAALSVLFAVRQWNQHLLSCVFIFSPGSAVVVELRVFNMMSLFLREGLMRSGRSDSFTSQAGRTTACPIMPPACWGLLGESSPRLWPTLGPWWFTAGWLISLCMRALSYHILELIVFWAILFTQQIESQQCSASWRVALCTDLYYSWCFREQPTLIWRKHCLFQDKWYFLVDIITCLQNSKVWLSEGVSLSLYVYGTANIFIPKLLSRRLMELLLCRSAAPVLDGQAASSSSTSCWTWRSEREWWTSITVWGSCGPGGSTWSRLR